jgi:hypothetical protein
MSQKNLLAGGNGIPQFKQQIATAAGITFSFFDVNPEDFILRPDIVIPPFLTVDFFILLCLSKRY